MQPDLKAFLLSHFGHIEGVTDQSNTLNVVALAAYLDIHPYTIWRWLSNGIPWRGAQTLMRVKPTITREELLPYLRG